MQPSRPCSCCVLRRGSTRAAYAFRCKSGLQTKPRRSTYRMHCGTGILCVAEGMAAGTGRTCSLQALKSRCAPSAAELASRPTPAALRLLQADSVRPRKRSARRVVQAQAALTAAPSQTADQIKQSKDQPVRAAPGNGQMESHAKRNSHDSAALNAESQVCQDESLTLLEWPEVCQQVRAKSCFNSFCLLLLHCSYT